MRINMRFIHFVLFLLLVLGQYPRLLAQAPDQDPPAEPENHAQPEGMPLVLLPSTQNHKRVTDTKHAICYRWNKETKTFDPQATCEVWFYWGAYDGTGGHQDGFLHGRLTNHYFDRHGNRKTRTKGQNRGNSISNLVKGSKSAPEMTTKPTPTPPGFSFPTVDEKEQKKGKVGTYTTPIGKPIKGFPFKIRTSQIGQQEWVIACNGPPHLPTDGGNCKRHNYDVKYPDLINYRTTIAANSNIMVPVGYQNSPKQGVRPRHPHPQNHSATETFWKAIKTTAERYHNEFYCYKTGSLRYKPIGINDMALPHGGIFDVFATWRPPHYSHHRGKAADIRCRPYPNPPTNPNSVIYYNNQGEREQPIVTRFLEICEEEGLGYARFEYKTDKKTGETYNHHCHCGVSESGEGTITPLRRSQQ